jgi:hypothetical protein
MKVFESKRLNITTSDGLLILSAKIHKGSRVAKLLLTDLDNKAEVWVDTNKETFLYGEVKLDEFDIKRVCAEIKNQEMSFDDKLMFALGSLE